MGYDSVYNSPQDNVSQFEELYGELKDSAFEPKKEKSPYRRLLLQVRSPFSTPKVRSPSSAEGKGVTGVRSSILSKTECTNPEIVAIEEPLANDAARQSQTNMVCPMCR